MMFYFLPFVIYLQLQSCQALLTYKSTLPLNATGPFAGIRLLKESIRKDTNFTNGISICVRFNYRQLGGGTFIFAHHKPGEDQFVMAQAGYDETFFFFGKMNWILKDMKTDSFLVWSTNRWHSICVCFDRNTSHITLVKVGTILGHT